LYQFVVEMPHELLEIPQGRLHQEMEVIAHLDVGEDIGPIDFGRAAQEIEEGRAVGIRGKDCLTGIASTGHVIVRILELDPKGPGHGGSVSETAHIIKCRDLTPILHHGSDP
jgi:hypothetical protein